MGPAAFTNCMFMISLAWEVHVSQDVVVGSGYGPTFTHEFTSVMCTKIDSTTTACNPS